jgi:hypothetical protein
MFNKSKEDVKQSTVEVVEKPEETQKDKSEKHEIINLDNVCKSIIELIEEKVKEKENNKFTPDEVDFLNLVISTSPQSCRDLENKITNIIYGNDYY